MDYVYEIELVTRDYECDVQGIVSNHNIIALFGHARHQFMKAMGFDLKALHDQGIDAMVVRSECDYKAPLFESQQIVIYCSIEQKGMLRVIFNQKMVRTDDAVEIASARFTGVVVEKGEVREPRELLSAYETYCSSRNL